MNINDTRKWSIWVVWFDVWTWSIRSSRVKVSEYSAHVEDEDNRRFLRLDNASHLAHEETFQNNFLHQHQLPDQTVAFLEQTKWWCQPDVIIGHSVWHSRTRWSTKGRRHFIKACYLWRLEHTMAHRIITTAIPRNELVNVPAILIKLNFTKYFYYHLYLNHTCSRAHTNISW